MSLLNRYVTAVSIVGITVLAAVVAATPVERLVPHDAVPWLFFAGLVIGECLPMRIVHHGSEGEITTSSTFALALLLTAGAPATMIAMTVAAVVADARQRKSPSRTLFNVGQYALAVGAASLALGALSDFVARTGSFAPDDLGGAIAAAIVFFVVNALLVSRAVSLVEGAPFWRFLRADLAMQTSTVGILLGLGPIVVITADFSILALPLLALPLVALHRSGRRAVDHQHEALHDELTGLPNRTLLHDRLEQGLVLARREGHQLAVMLLDLDRFKEINDTLGHHEGDAVLRTIADRLRAALRASDTVARLGGDEFAVVLPHVTGTEGAMSLATALGEAIAEPYSTPAGMALDLRASIGVAVAPDNGDDVTTLIRKADIAMYQAKQSGAGAASYTAAADDSTPERLRLVTDLRAAIANGEVVMHFQPKVSLTTGRIESLEALARWEHPRLGLLHPAHFIEVAERSGLIGALTRVAIDSALCECRHWLDAGLDIGVAVNLSPRSLRDDAIVEDVALALGRHDVPGRLLQLELTESSFVADTGAACAVIERLRTLGVSIAIDDFGTGYSSLGHLKDLPIDELKIDRAFVAGLEAGGSAEAAIVRSTIQLGHDLGLRVVAEGVETSTVLGELASLGCDAVQGYLLGRPKPADRVLGLLDRSPSSHDAADTAAATASTAPHVPSTSATACDATNAAA